MGVVVGVGVQSPNQACSLNTQTDLNTVARLGTATGSRLVALLEKPPIPGNETPAESLRGEVGFGVRVGVSEDGHFRCSVKGRRLSPCPRGLAPPTTAHTSPL